MASISRTISASEVIPLGNASDDGVGTIAISITSLSGTHSMVPKGRITGSGVAAAEYQNLAYKPANTGTLTNPGTTPITTEGIYFIPADGCDVFLDVTVTSDTFKLDVIPLRG